MKKLKLIKLISFLSIIIFFNACVSVPVETVTLSQTLGGDLKVLQDAHCNMVEIHFSQIKNDINAFIDDVYAPFVIHYVLKSELNAFENGQPSLYGTIELAGQIGGKEETSNAVNEMFDFQDAARKQIESKRKELLAPIIKQETEIIKSVNQSYSNAIYANNAITGYLKSVRKVKETQQEALSLIGLEGVDEKISDSLMKISKEVGKAIEIGKDIDIKSDDAYKQLEEISEQIKKITNKN